MAICTFLSRNTISDGPSLTLCFFLPKSPKQILQIWKGKNKLWPKKQIEMLTTRIALPHLLKIWSEEVFHENVFIFLPIINIFYFPNHKIIDLANLERKKQALAKKADRNANDEDRYKFLQKFSPSLEDLKRRGIIN